MRSRRAFLLAGAAATLTPVCAGAYGPDPPAIAEDVRREFLHAWQAYRRFAWGYDEVRPISGAPASFFIDGTSFGLSIVEALDTHYVMGNDAELEECVAWLRANLHFDVRGKVQMFEAVIRLVGGLIAGYYVTGERFLFDAARELADRLMVCFSKSPSGAPYRFVDLRTGEVDGAETNLAEIGSNVLEFGELTRLTGDPKYLDASMRAFRAVVERRSPLDLLGTIFNVEKGDFVGDDDVAPDAPSDSFYEYLWGGWAMLGNAQTRDWFRMLVRPLNRYATVRIGDRLWYRPVNRTTGQPMGAAAEHELIAFWAELLAKSGDLATGAAFYDSWTAVLDTFSLPPETVDIATLSAVDPAYLLRPEYANAAFDLYFLTRDEKYRATAYRYFQALRAHCRTPNGYTVLTDVRTRPMTQGDYFPAYAFSENFKYLYLMFAGSGRFDGSAYYLNTEGKILRGLKATPVTVPPPANLPASSLNTAFAERR